MTWEELQARINAEQLEGYWASLDDGSYDGIMGLRGQLLNPEVARLVKRIGHTQALIICDLGFPIPDGVPTVNMALSPGIPTVLDIMDAIAADFSFDRIICAQELVQTAERLATHTERVAALRTRAAGKPVESYPHAELKQLARHASGCIRSADRLAFGNIILIGG